MGAPGVGEAAIYDALVKEQACRIAVTVDYKAWTADRTLDLSGPLDKADVQWSPGAKATVHDDAAWIRGWGVPCFEWFRTRDDFFPEDPAIPFRARWRGIFHQADPVYTVGLVFGAIDGAFGPVDDLRVLQVGAVDVAGLSSSFYGKLLFNRPGAILTPDVVSTLTMAYDGAEHTIEVEWDPGNSPQYRVLIDGTGVYSSDTAPRPVYIGVGYPTFVEAYVPYSEPPQAYVAPGTPDAPVDLIETREITVESLDGVTYETITFPGWTTNNAGGNLSTAAEGERFTLANRTAAKLFMSNVISARVSRSKSSEFDSFQVTLALPKLSDPDGYVNLYAGTRWDCEPQILIDTRVANDAGTWTAWRRQIAGRIWKHHIEYGMDGVPHLLLSGPCIAFAQLYSEASLAFIKAEEELPGIYQNLTFTEVFETLGAEAANLDGHEWESSYDVHAPDASPDAIGTGGQTLLQAFNDWADRLAQSRHVRYATSGPAEFGEVVVALQNIGTGTGAYGFRGLGGSASYPLMGASLDTDSRQAPGQVQYHPNLVRTGLLDIATYGAPGVMVYPAFPYPANSAGWSDSIPYTQDGLSSLIGAFPDENAVNHYGGIGKQRLRNETVRAKPLTFEVIGRDHIEVDDEIDLDDPDGTGYVGSIVVDSLEIEYANSKITTRGRGFVTDPTAVMLRRR